MDLREEVFNREFHIAPPKWCRLLVARLFSAVLSWGTHSRLSKIGLWIRVDPASFFGSGVVLLSKHCQSFWAVSIRLDDAFHRMGNWLRKVLENHYSQPFALRIRFIFNNKGLKRHIFKWRLHFSFTIPVCSGTMTIWTRLQTTSVFHSLMLQRKGETSVI